MKRFILLSFVLALVSCGPRVVEKTPDEKVADLLNARFDSLALNCSVHSVALKDTLWAELTSADPEYRELGEKWLALMEAGVSPNADEYKAARQAMKDYEEAWVSEPVALVYTCIVECDEFVLKSMIESGEFAISLDRSKILEIQK